MTRSSLLLVALVVWLLAPIAVGRAAEPAPEGASPAPDRQGEAPPAYTLSTPISRMVLVRLRNKTDVVEGLKKAIEEQGIRNAVIVGGFGSLIRYHVHVVTNQTSPPTDGYMKAEQPQDVLNLSGYVIDGRLHPHITMSDEKTALGGHIEPGTHVHTFLNVALAVLPDDLRLDRFDDWEWK